MIDGRGSSSHYYHKSSGGIGSPWSWRSVNTRDASALTRSTASASVCPYANTPGNIGTSASQWPSSSRSTVTSSFIARSHRLPGLSQRQGIITHRAKCLPLVPKLCLRVSHVSIAHFIGQNRAPNFGAGNPPAAGCLISRNLGNLNVRRPQTLFGNAHLGNSVSTHTAQTEFRE